MSSDPLYLRFGIPSLDRLITGHAHGTRLADQLPTGILLGENWDQKRQAYVDNGAKSVSIIGPDGTGKSVLGLHLASRYVADCWELRKAKPFVLYVSTDLNFETAFYRTWTPFALDRPGIRRVPFARRPSYENLDSRTVKLLKIDPFQDMAEFLLSYGRNSEPELQVGFIDLARNTAGDDWGYVVRLLALLPPPAESSPKHLVIVDAVEGLETLGGERDAFGEPVSRRSRIAQLMRVSSAGLGKSHLALIVEEVSRDERIPEVFITDYVVRLREIEANGYARRTIQIEKARGYPHVRGQHPFVIRSGEGSTTGRQHNSDDPRIEREGVSQAYFHIFRSLNYLSRTTMQTQGEPQPQPPRGEFAGFGIEYLDDMLAGDGRPLRRNDGRPTDSGGLPCASISALIGDPETQKTRLGRAFLARCFAGYPARIEETIPACRTGNDPPPPQPYLYAVMKLAFGEDCCGEYRNPKIKPVLDAGWALFNNRLKRLEEGVPILLSNHDIDNHGLSRDFRRLLSHGSNDGLADRWSRLASRFEVDERVLHAAAEYHFAERTVCRRLEIHDLSAAIFMHIVESCVQQAQRLHLDRELAHTSGERFSGSIGIRLVVDDLSVIRATYSETFGENLLLPYLFFYLRREGITTLVVNTHAERPGHNSSDRFQEELRALVDNRLYTWHIPFYGKDRIAIAPIPPMEEKAGIRELRLPRPSDTVELKVDPHFELYAGLEEGNPSRIPLEIRLFQETKAFETYIDRENLAYGEAFKAAPGCASVIVPQRTGEYEVLHEACSLEDRRRLNHSLVFQVDEFWSIGRKALRGQRSYLEAQTVDSDGQPATVEDPLGLFQLSSDDPAGRPKRRREFFSPIGYSLDDSVGIDRVPFTWDFGFLLCRERCWTEAKNEALGITGQDGRKVLVGNVWDAMTKVWSSPRERAIGTHRTSTDLPLKPADYSPKLTSWRVFLEACQIVARHEGFKSTSSITAFDLSLLAAESFSCLVLEMWASEINKKDPNFSDRVSGREWQPDAGNSLLDWLIGNGRTKDAKIVKEGQAWLDGSLATNGNWMELYKVWLLLVEVLDVSKLVEPARNLEFKPRESDESAVAVRHWYKTAAAKSDTFDPSDPFTACRLPGNFTARGDWFLGVFTGSRSDRLADQALDLLSSRRANATRLQMGLGLPTRRIVNTGHDDSQRVNLFKCGERGERERATYQDILDIGAGQDFHWLWRSRISHYDRQARIWHKWLGRTLLFWNRVRYECGSAWNSGFTVYDFVDTGNVEQLKNQEIQSLLAFASRCDVLAAELMSTTPAATVFGPQN